MSRSLLAAVILLGILNGIVFAGIAHVLYMSFSPGIAGLINVGFLIVTFIKIAHLGLKESNANIDNGDSVL